VRIWVLADHAHVCPLVSKRRQFEVIAGARFDRDNLAAGCLIALANRSRSDIVNEYIELTKKRLGVLLRVGRASNVLRARATNNRDVAIFRVNPSADQRKAVLSHLRQKR